MLCFNFFSGTCPVYFSQLLAKYTIARDGDRSDNDSRVLTSIKRNTNYVKLPRQYISPDCPKWTRLVDIATTKPDACSINHNRKYRSLEGDDFPRTVVWEFPSYEKALKCYNSKDYQEGWALAKETTVRSLQIVEGFNTE